MNASFVRFSALLGTCSIAFAACGGSGTDVSTAQPVRLPAASASLCVPAAASAQTVALPDTGGVTASLDLPQYDVGASGCQNITIATGDAASNVAAAASRRRTQAASEKPIVSITLGEGLPSSLGLVTVLAGATLNTDPNLHFPDGTYKATLQIAALGVTTSVQLSLVFTASNGKLTITGGTQLPVNLGSGAQLLIYDRGVTPPGFFDPTPAPSASASASPIASPNPSASPTIAPTASPTPTPGPAGSIADGTVLGTYVATFSALPGASYLAGRTASGSIVYGSAAESVQNCTIDPTTGDETGCIFTGTEFDAAVPPGGNAPYPGVVSYALPGLAAKSYRIQGCTGAVSYGGGGTSGVMSTAYVASGLTFNDSCVVELFSQPASVVNSDPQHGAGYTLYFVTGPVAQADSTYPPAMNVPSPSPSSNH